MPSAPDLAGSALDGRYELHELIGEGTFGRVYRGLDRRLRRPVAIKVIKPWWSEDPEWVERFEREAQLLARVSDPGIVQIFDVGRGEEGLYYVAELVDGESLAARLRRGPVSVADAGEVALQLARALSHTHACGVIHRDIKPANVLLDRAGRVKLGDFSIARLAEGSSEGPATIAGTPKYMAPEQARGLAATPATDVYSLGVVLYEMLAGRSPFKAGSPVELALRHLQDPPPPLPPRVPRPLAAVTLRALEKAPGDRYASALEMAAELEAALTGAPGATLARASGQPRRISTSTPGPGSSARAARPGQAERTRVAPRFAPRRTANPAARRRALALVLAVCALAVAMALAALLIGTPTRVSVPSLRGLPRASVTAALAHEKLHGRFAGRYSAATTAGVAIAQSPAAGRRVTQGSAVRVVLSLGPPPVTLPRLAGQAATAAQAVLTRLGLRPEISPGPAPAGTTPGTVLGQRPAAGRSVPAHSTVTLSVAETPRWRTVGTFAGTDAGHSATFAIRGAQWRVVYRMSYVGTCTLIFFCDGPTAHIHELATGASTSFDLGEGSDKLHTLSTGPGRYRIEVTPGNDTASWSFTVQDDY